MSKEIKPNYDSVGALDSVGKDERECLAVVNKLVDFLHSYKTFPNKEVNSVVSGLVGMVDRGELFFNLSQNTGNGSVEFGTDTYSDREVFVIELPSNFPSLTREDPVLQLQNIVFVSSMAVNYCCGELDMGGENMGKHIEEALSFANKVPDTLRDNRKLLNSLNLNI